MFDFHYLKQCKQLRGKVTIHYYIVSGNERSHMFLCAFDSATDIGNVNSRYCISVSHYIIRGLCTLYVQVNINFSADKQQKHLTHQHLKIFLKHCKYLRLSNAKMKRFSFPKKLKSSFFSAFLKYSLNFKRLFYICVCICIMRL